MVTKLSLRSIVELWNVQTHHRYKLQTIDIDQNKSIIVKIIIKIIDNIPTDFFLLYISVTKKISNYKR